MTKYILKVKYYNFITKTIKCRLMTLPALSQLRIEKEIRDWDEEFGYTTEIEILKTIEND